jgi:hypothetical protein
MLRCRRFGGSIETHLEADLAEGFIDFLVKIRGIIDEESLGLDDASDGGGSQADGAQDTGNLIEISGISAGFDELAGKNADEGDLFGEALDVGIFDTGEVAPMDAAGVEAVLEGIGVAELTTTAARCGRDGFVWINHLLDHLLTGIQAGGLECLNICGLE